MKICKVKIINNWNFNGRDIKNEEMDAVETGSGYLLVEKGQYIWINSSDCLVLKEKEFKFEDDTTIDSSKSSLLGAIGAKPQELIIKF